MTVLARLRRFWLDVHLWIGVALFFPFVVLGVTGSVLTFHDELERLMSPHRYEVTAGAPASLQAILEAGRAEAPAGFVISGVRPPAHEGAPALVQARSLAQPAPGARPETRTIYVDPVTARVLDVANTRADAFGVLHQLHGSLMIPEIGRKVVGWMGWAMLASSLTGLWLWWPRNGALLKGLRWKRSPRTTSNLHHLTGFWLTIPLAILAFTGAYISFPQLSRSVVGAFVALPESRGPSGPPGGGAAPIDAPRMSVDAVAAAAREAAPDAELVAINLPTPGRDGEAPSWRVQVKRPDAEALANIGVDDATGEAKAQGAPQADQNLARWMRRLHDGTDYPMAWRVIIALAGLAPALLGVTGVVMWLRRRAARRAVRRSRVAAE
ncbi:MAG: PepSY-associated TM helix domain-containing protein [Hyphomonadaceae bacterium]|nr:PepSY-associated TM helix domain-containing protein [Hyphomonadaceae bacterium]